MAELLLMLKDVVWFSHNNRIVIDSSEFKISSQFTPGLLVLGSMIVTTRQFFGQPIKCDSGAVCHFNLQRVQLNSSV